MAMNGDILGDAIRADIQAALSGLEDVHDASVADQTLIMRAMGNAIVSHITTYGVATNTYVLSAVTITSIYPIT